MEDIVEVIQKAKKTEKERKAGVKKNTKLTLLGHLEQIVELSLNSGLKDDFFEKAKPHLNHVKRVLHLNDIQAVFLSHFMDKSDSSSIYISEISNSVKCRTLKLIQHMDDIDVLEKRRLIRCSRGSNQLSYRVPREVVEALRKNENYQPVKRTNIPIEELFEELAKLFSEKEDNELTYSALEDEIEDLLTDNPHLEFSKGIKKYAPVDNNKILLLFFCHLFVENNDDNIRFHDFDNLYESKSTFRYIKGSLSDKSNELFELGLIENPNTDGFEDRESFKLTDKAKNELLGELNIVQKRTKNKKDLILCTSLTGKKMFYNENEHIQTGQLTSLLKEEHFKSIKNRLTDKGMRTGFACLFHGAPGTGKTETVYQIARETGRDIMLVDISQTKSMWFGESEKKIKEVFDSYKACVKEAKIAPILLFNEADAVINKRQEIGGSSIDKTENAIQNIILQEMENLDGIMIATTNLTQNLDKAFERRFLYKIEFKKPGPDAKKSIWQSIIPTLSEREAKELANRYDFSGGQIENISRKCTVDSIISGKEPTIEALIFHCQNEMLTQNRQPIGFNR
ncbi:MAG: ATP-binding protein [Prevotella sp.]|jgi:SpoVK/Ycf46/Vps4 family AAA+-type ATPase|nr:ATP-binding protein [Prevotella sp.]